MNNIIYAGGTAVPRIDDNQKYFLNHLTILYGPSGSGKSSIIMHILNTIRDVIPIALVCNPTNDLNGDYNGIIPNQCIYNDLTKELLQKIFVRQTNVIAMYKLVHDPKHLRSMYNLIADQPAKELAEKLDNILATGTSKINSSYEPEDIENALKDLHDRYNHKMVKLTRKFILQNMAKLNSMELTDLHKMILDNFVLNPNLLLLLDDCAANIKEWKDLTETKQLFFQGRHFKVTTILTMQNEAIIPPPLRTNAHISIFTTNKIVNTYFAKASSGVGNDERKQIVKISNAIFASSDNDKPNYKKLVIMGQVIKTENKIQYIIANPKKRRFGSSAFWELCNQVKRETPVAFTSNTFSKMFSVKPSSKLEQVPNYD